MRIKAIAPIFNLSIENNAEFKFEGCIITNSINFKNNKITKNFKELFGETAVRVIKNTWIICYEGDPRNIPMPIFNDNTSFPSIAHNFNGYFQSLFSAFWFLKDDAITIPLTYVESLTSRSAGFHSFSAMLISSSSGKDVMNEYTLEEMKAAGEKFTELDKFYNNNDNAVTFKRRINHHANDPNVNKTFKPYDYSRSARSILFLRSIRLADEPIVKISYHMAMYECLFLTSNEDVCKLLRKRVSIFIGGTSGEKRAIRNLITATYDIRSRYMHGDTVQFTVDEIRIFSSEVDNLTRKILNKILSMEDNHMFTQSETEHTKEAFEHYFLAMVESGVTPT